MRRKIMAAGMLLAGMLALSGCKDAEPLEALTAEYLQAGDVQMETLYVRTDGTVQVAYIEEFGEDYYNVTELQGFIKDMVADYNQEQGETAVIVEEVAEQDDMVYAILTCRDVEAYVDFNDDEPLSEEAYAPQLEVLTVEEATERYGSESFNPAKSGKSMVTGSEVFNAKKQNVMVVTGPMRVQTSGNILYYTGGRLINDRELEVSEGNTTVIIYKK